MKVVFTGSRNWPYYQPVWDDLYDLAGQAIDAGHSTLHVYVGDCPTGVDDDVDSWCENSPFVSDFSDPTREKRVHVKLHTFHAEWDKCGKGAGPIRNAQMVEAACADGVEDVQYRAYMLNGSAGTMNCVGHLETAGVPGVLQSLTIQSTLPGGRMLARYLGG